MKEYKILTQKDRLLGKKFDPERIEIALNAYAEEGWELKMTATTEFPGWMSTREQLLMFMEREKTS